MLHTSVVPRSSFEVACHAALCPADGGIHCFIEASSREPLVEDLRDSGLLSLNFVFLYCSAQRRHLYAAQTQHNCRHHPYDGFHTWAKTTLIHFWFDWLFCCQTDIIDALNCLLQSAAKSQNVCKWLHLIELVSQWDRADQYQTHDDCLTVSDDLWLQTHLLKSSLSECLKIAF